MSERIPSLANILGVKVPKSCSAPEIESLLMISGLPDYEDRPDECRGCPNALKTNSTDQFVCAVALYMQIEHHEDAISSGLELDFISEVPVALNNQGDLPQNLYEGTDLAQGNCPLREILVKEAGAYIADLATDCEQKGVPFNLEKETLFITVPHPGSIL